MSIDRAATLRNAEKLVRQGRLDAAIAEYVRVTEDSPRDWNSANTLGDLYARAGSIDRAVEQYVRIADSLANEGFLPKAIALYKKTLKARPDHEHALLRAGETAASLGLLVDARAYLNALAERLERRGDQDALAAVKERLAEMAPDDSVPRLAAIRARAQGGDRRGAAQSFRELADALMAESQAEAAISVLEEALALQVDEAEVRYRLFAACLAGGHLQRARQIAGAPQEFKALADCFEVDGRHDEAFEALNAGVDAAAAEREWTWAMTVLQGFAERNLHHIPTLRRLVEVSVEGGDESTIESAQAQLAEAHLAAGSAGEARAIAEDLLTRNPSEPANVDRLRRALVLAGEQDVEGAIARVTSKDDVGLDGGMAFDIHGEADGVTLVREEAPAIDVAADLPALAPPSDALSVPEDDGSPDEVDLTLMLDGRPSVDVSPADLESVFQGFRDDARRRTTLDGLEEQYAKGMALYNSGDIDDCIGPLEEASRAPHLRFEVAAVLGRIFRTRGRLADSIEWFERAAESPAASPEEGYRLLYELAGVLESAGERDRALAVYLELQSDAGTFRDVGSRIERLSQG